MIEMFTENVAYIGNGITIAQRSMSYIVFIIYNIGHIIIQAQSTYLTLTRALDD